jgi:hypothetical protein
MRGGQLIKVLGDNVGGGAESLAKSLTAHQFGKIASECNTADSILALKETMLKLDKSDPEYGAKLRQIGEHAGFRGPPRPETFKVLKEIKGTYEKLVGGIPNTTLAERKALTSILDKPKVPSTAEVLAQQHGQAKDNKIGSGVRQGSTNKVADRYKPQGTVKQSGRSSSIHQ